MGDGLYLRSEITARHGPGNNICPIHKPLPSSFPNITCLSCIDLTIHIVDTGSAGTPRSHIGVMVMCLQTFGHFEYLSVVLAIF